MSLIDSSKISAQLTNYKFKASGPHIRQSNESTDRYTFRNTCS